MIIAHTVKGKGNAAVEDIVDSHHVHVGDRETYDRLLAGLGYTYPLPYDD